MMNRKLMYTALSASLLLAACGTDNDNEKTDSAGVEDSAETVNTDTEGTDTNTDSTEQSDSSESADDSSAEGSETDGSDSAGEGTESEGEESGEAGEDTSAALPDSSEVPSDAQDFKMQVLNGYTLTSEEPGRDVLYVKDDDSYFMTIETADSAEVDYDKAVENISEKLAATSSDASPAELTEGTQLPESGGLEKLKAYRVLAAEGAITGMVFEREGMLVKVMIYDNNDEAYYDDFLKMAETIVSTK